MEPRLTHNKAIHKFPKESRVRTPSGRYAYVLHYDEENRVHVRYEESCYGPNKNELGHFPARLLSQFSAAPIYDERHKMPNTEIQDTCGHGDSSLELKTFLGRDRTLPRRYG